MFCDAEEIALGVREGCPLDVGVLVEHIPAIARAEGKQSRDLALPRNDSRGRPNDEHLRISMCG